MIKRRDKWLALVLAAAMALSLMACGGSGSPASSGGGAEGGQAGTEAAAPAAEGSETPLVVGYSPFNSKFSLGVCETPEAA